MGKAARKKRERRKAEQPKRDIGAGIQRLPYYTPPPADYWPDLPPDLSPDGSVLGPPRIKGLMERELEQAERNMIRMVSEDMADRLSPGWYFTDSGSVRLGSGNDNQP